MDLNYIDIGIVVLTLLSALVGFVRGFVREAISLTTWVAAIALAFIFAETLSAKLPFNISHDLARMGVSFLLIFIGVIVLGSIINYLFTKAISAIGLGAVDRVLGGAFGVLRGALIVTLAVLLLGLGLTPITEMDLWKTSQLIPHFSDAAEWLKESIPENVAEQIKALGERLGISAEDIPINSESAVTTPAKPE
ncbi:MAG: Colicin V production protein [uncultured Thiotrichaceae bacterium]|uniref:Colicin V production protein n=1 Tax=uncultured Thiotrichaceae bacterium TaxID=298394 RepID=A0A6S6SWF6_9GAMM|nr:MAG: Colicin V production protein [uncultured Thiotrichaceae bacterium]